MVVLLQPKGRRKFKKEEFVYGKKAFIKERSGVSVVSGNGTN